MLRAEWLMRCLRATLLPQVGWSKRKLEPDCSKSLFAGVSRSMLRAAKYSMQNALPIVLLRDAISNRVTGVTAAAFLTRFPRHILWSLGVDPSKVFALRQMDAPVTSCFWRRASRSFRRVSRGWSKTRLSVISSRASRALDSSCSLVLLSRCSSLASISAPLLPLADIKNLTPNFARYSLPLSRRAARTLSSSWNTLACSLLAILSSVAALCPMFP
mmetsp:Transcript_19201/g.34159  ORF Transcript_19201/g.34159 Transcript_19201/m.34159 type:complete len:216 (-) Transcript_19201:2321-2968(-)